MSSCVSKSKVRAGVVTITFLLALPMRGDKAEDATLQGGRHRVSLSEMVDEALAMNPLLQAGRRSFDAKKSLVAPATTLPEPKVNFQTMGNLIPPTLQGGDPSSGRIVSFSQEIPFPGKLRLQGRVASMESEMEWWSYEQLRRQIVAEVKVAYYEHWLISKSLEIVEKNKDLLQKFAQISEAKYRVGEGIQQDVVKAQVDVSKLLDRRVVLQQREEVSTALLNSLLYRQPEASLGRIEEVRPSPFATPPRTSVGSRTSDTPMSTSFSRKGPISTGRGRGRWNT